LVTIDFSCSSSIGNDQICIFDNGSDSFEVNLLEVISNSNFVSNSVEICQDLEDRHLVFGESDNIDDEMTIEGIESEERLHAEVFLKSREEVEVKKVELIRFLL
jgi:archaellum component FlaF (FlaF/FlaG flagellin family)